MLLVAAFVLTQIAASMLFRRCSTTRGFIALISTSISTVVLLICCFVMLGSYKQTCLDIKEKQLHVISEYNASPKAEQDWRWLVEHIDEYNEALCVVNNDDTMYKLFDAWYLVDKDNIDVQQISVCEDADHSYLIVPDSYDVISPRYDS